MNKKIIISALVILAILGIVISLKSKTVVAPVVPVTQNSTTSFTLADVAKHAVASSCWTAVTGQVYDMTAWISQHPGGERAILSMCGKDGTKDFMDQHDGQGRPERELAKYAIGALK